MSAAAFLFVVVAVVVTLAALLSIVVVRRAARTAGRALARLDERLIDRNVTLVDRLETIRASLESTDAAAERTLWALVSADDRMDRLTQDMAAKRAASDTLRVRFIDGQLSIARARELVRLIVRLDQLRRDLG